MKAIDRVMAAYAKVHKLTDEQAATARKELSRFIDQLLSGRMPGSSENQTKAPSDSNLDARGSNRGDKATNNASRHLCTVCDK
jgi:hypothetical protein